MKTYSWNFIHNIHEWVDQVNILAKEGWEVLQIVDDGKAGRWALMVKETPGNSTVKK